MVRHILMCSKEFWTHGWLETRTIPVCPGWETKKKHPKLVWTSLLSRLYFNITSLLPLSLIYTVYMNSKEGFNRRGSERSFWKETLVHFSQHHHSAFQQWPFPLARQWWWDLALILPSFCLFLSLKFSMQPLSAQNVWRRERRKEKSRIKSSRDTYTLVFLSFKPAQDWVLHSWGRSSYWKMPWSFKAKTFIKWSTTNYLPFVWVDILISWLLKIVHLAMEVYTVSIHLNSSCSSGAGLKSAIFAQNGMMQLYFSF